MLLLTLNMSGQNNMPIQIEQDNSGGIDPNFTWDGTSIQKELDGDSLTIAEGEVMTSERIQKLGDDLDKFIVRHDQLLLNHIVERIENMSIETVGNSAKTADQILNIIKNI